MSHITSYLVGEGLGEIQGKQKASYSFIPLEMGQFVVSLTSLKGNWSVFWILQTNPESKEGSIHCASIFNSHCCKTVACLKRELEVALLAIPVFHTIGSLS